MREVKHARSGDRGRPAFVDHPEHVLVAPAAPRGDDGDGDRVRDGPEGLDVVSGHRSVPFDRREQDLSGAGSVTATARSTAPHGVGRVPDSTRPRTTPSSAAFVSIATTTHCEPNRSAASRDELGVVDGGGADHDLVGPDASSADIVDRNGSRRRR